MRHALLAVLIALTAQTTTDSAQACGYYTFAPRIFRVESHHGHTFAIMGIRADQRSMGWRGNPQSFDPTEVANLEPLPSHVPVTVVGEQGVRLENATRHAALRNIYNAPGVHDALVLSRNANDVIAIEGDHQVQWTALVSTFQRADWDYEVGSTRLSLGAAADGPLMTTIRSKDGAIRGTRTGVPLGMATIDGVPYLIIDNKGAVYSVLMSWL